MESAPEEIREFQLYYLSLRNQEEYFLKADEGSWESLNGIVKLSQALRESAAPAIESTDHPFKEAYQNALQSLILNEPSPFVQQVLALVAFTAKITREPAVKNSSSSLEMSPLRADKQSISAKRKLYEQIDELLLKKIPELSSEDHDDLLEQRCANVLHSLVEPLTIARETLALQLKITPVLTKIAEKMDNIASRERPVAPLNSSCLFKPPSQLRELRREMLRERNATAAAPSLVPTRQQIDKPTLELNDYAGLTCLK